MNRIKVWLIVALVVLQFALLLGKTSGLASYPGEVAWLPCILVVLLFAGMLIFSLAERAWRILMGGAALIAAVMIVGKALGLIACTWGVALIALDVLVAMAILAIVLYFLTMMAP